MQVILSAAAVNLHVAPYSLLLQPLWQQTRCSYCKTSLLHWPWPVGPSGCCTSVAVASPHEPDTLRKGASGGSLIAIFSSLGACASK